MLVFFFSAVDKAGNAYSDFTLLLPPVPGPCAQVLLGEHHNLLLTDTGSVYAWCVFYNLLALRVRDYVRLCAPLILGLAHLSLIGQWSFLHGVHMRVVCSSDRFVHLFPFCYLVFLCFLNHIYAAETTSTGSWDKPTADRSVSPPGNLCAAFMGLTSYAFASAVKSSVVLCLSVSDCE